MRTVPSYVLTLFCDDRHVIYKFLSFKENGLIQEEMVPLSKCKEYIVVGKQIRRSWSLSHKYAFNTNATPSLCKRVHKPKNYVLFKKIFFIWLNNPEMVFLDTFRIK